MAIWLDAPREGFTQRCIAYFGVGFSADRSIVRSAHISDMPRRTTPEPLYALTDVTGSGGRRGGRSRHASARIQHGAALLSTGAR